MILWRRLAKRFVCVQHRPRLFLFLLRRYIAALISFKRFALGRRRTIGLDTKDLVETKTGEQLPASISAMHDTEMAVPEFFQAQGYTGHGAHKRGIHHGTISQVDDELTVTTVDHLLGELLKVPAIQETSLSFHLHPNGRTVHPYLDR